MTNYLLLLFLMYQLHLVMNENSCGCGNNREKTGARKSNNIYISDDNTAECSANSVNVEDSDVSQITKNMVFIPEGVYQVGTDDVVTENDREGPMRFLDLDEFYLDKFEVSNSDFESFVKATKYQTEAEVFGDSFVFTLFLNDSVKESLKDYRVLQAPWWYKVSGADWSHPYGPDSDIKELKDHPVIHVSWKDAQAFCKWRGARLPTENEWEAACRGGKRGTKYPWGDKLFQDRQHRTNIWQGSFPNFNSNKDGYIGTNPVNEFEQNDFGLHNMAGNVWEWVEDAWDKNTPNEKVKKGGSYLCHRSYCYRYRCSARSHNTEDSSAGNLGFRCAKSLR